MADLFTHYVLDDGLPIAPSRHARFGWTHGDGKRFGRDVTLWVGVRCPGKLTGAVPEGDPRWIEATGTVLGRSSSVDSRGDPT